MSDYQALKDKLDELVADPFSTPEECDEIRKLLEKCAEQAEPLAPAEPALSPILDEALRQLQGSGEVLKATSIMQQKDFEAIAQMGKALGVDTIQTAQLRSQIEALYKDFSNTDAGLFCLRILVENLYLHKRIAELHSITNHAVVSLKQIHSEPKPAKQKAKK